MAGDTDPRESAVSESDIPESMSQGEAEQLFSENIEHLLGLEVKQGSDSDDDDADQRETESDDDDDGQDQRETESDDVEGDDDTDQRETESDDDDDEKQASGLWVRDDKGKLKPVTLDQEIPIEIGGEDVSLTLGELRDGFMRTRDYTKKTQAIAATVAGKVEEGIAQARSEIEERGRTLAGFVGLFDGMVPKQPSLEALQRQYNDPATAARVYDQQVKLRAKITQASQEAANVQEQQQRNAVSQQINAAKSTLEIVRETDPRWKSEDDAKREFNAVQSYLQELELGDDDLVAILQKPAYVSIVMDAIYGQAVKKAKRDVGRKRQAATTRKVQRTAREQTRQPSNDRAELRKRVRQNGDEAAALKLIEGII